MKALQIESFEHYKKIYQKSVTQPEEFWSSIAENFFWRKPWHTVLQWNFDQPKIKWFDGAKLNITENIFDAHLRERAEQTAIIWEPNHPSHPNRTLSYQQLFNEVNQLANALKNQGIQKGDRICIYMPMIPELTIAVLACARIGAVHSVIFAGFSAQAIADRLNDAQAKMIITSDGMYRGDKTILLKPIIDQALLMNQSVQRVLVFDYLSAPINWIDNRDLNWKKITENQSDICPAEIMEAEDPLFILYTSGSTGKPKGVVHSTAGYMVYTAYSFQNVFQYQSGDLYWCTADIGWITGHSYIIYGPLLCGAKTLMFEGIPTFPNPSRFWEIIDKYKVNQFLTAPTAIRSLMACGDDWLNDFKLDSLKIISSVGEPINEEAWQWYFKKIGKEKCPVVDSWWQTETGGIMISGLGNISPLKPTFAGFPLPGIQPVLLDQNGTEIHEADVEGYLCIKTPWPSIIRTTYNDHERCRLNYFSHYKGYYFTGDGAKRDENGMFRIIGRIDDVINVSGHRFGTAEIENAINTSLAVVESGVVAYPHPIKGQSIYAFVIVNEGIEKNLQTKNIIIDSVSNAIGKIAIPEKIQFVNALPKTRSGKIMRRILRKVAEGDFVNIGDTSTLLDPSVVQQIISDAL